MCLPPAPPSYPSNQPQELTTNSGRMGRTGTGSSRPSLRRLSITVDQVVRHPSPNTAGPSLQVDLHCQSTTESPRAVPSKGGAHANIVTDSTTLPQRVFWHQRGVHCIQAEGCNATTHPLTRVFLGNRHSVVDAVAVTVIPGGLLWCGRPCPCQEAGETFAAACASASSSGEAPWYLKAYSSSADTTGNTVLHSASNRKNALRLGSSCKRFLNVGSSMTEHCSMRQLVMRTAVEQEVEHSAHSVGVGCGVVWCGVGWGGVVPKALLPIGKGQDVLHTGKCTTGRP